MTTEYLTKIVTLKAGVFHFYIEWVSKGTFDIPLKNKQEHLI